MVSVRQVVDELVSSASAGQKKPAMAAERSTQELRSLLVPSCRRRSCTLADLPQTLPRCLKLPRLVREWPARLARKVRSFSYTSVRHSRH